MLAIWKYHVVMNDRFDLVMPKGARVLSVGEQRGQVQMWVVVDPDAAVERREFHVIGTGHPHVDAYFEGRFVGTVICSGAALVWHIFESIKAEPAEAGQDQDKPEGGTAE